MSRLPATDMRRSPAIESGSGPIFVHSSFRTSSTWIWQKLRAVPHVTAYYEVFNEALGYFRKRDVGGRSASTWTSKHPVSAPYFLEYLALLKEGGGLPAFDASMPYDRFIPAQGIRGELSVEERVYLETLIQASRDNGRVPVLTCTRTLGRASAINTAFGGTSILIVRNLFHQWASYSGQAARGNPYFLQTINKTINASLHDDFISDINEYFCDRIESEDNRDLFLIFLILHLYLYAQAFNVSDFVVDTTKIYRDSDYRLEIESIISNAVGCPVDLSDVSENFESFFVDIGDRRVFADTLDHFVNLIKAGAPSVSAAVYVEQLKNEIFAEFDTHEFYAAKSRSVLVERIGREQNERAEAIGRSEALSHQLSELESSRAVASAEIERLGQEIANLSQSVLELNAQAEGSNNLHAEETAALRQGAERVSAERDVLAEQLASERAAAAAERSALEHAFSVERHRVEEQLQAQRSASAAERSELELSLASILAERVALSEERDGLLKAVADLTHERDTITKLYRRGMIKTVRARLASVLRPK